MAMKASMSSTGFLCRADVLDSPGSANVCNCCPLALSIAMLPESLSLPIPLSLPGSLLDLSPVQCKMVLYSLPKIYIKHMKTDQDIRNKDKNKGNGRRWVRYVKIYLFKSFTLG